MTKFYERKKERSGEGETEGEKERVREKTIVCEIEKSVC